MSCTWGSSKHHCATKAQEPLETDLYCSADPSKGELLKEQAFYQCPLCFRHNVVFWRADKLATTRLTLMILFPVVNVTILLISCRSTPWARVSHNHGSLLASALSFPLWPTLLWRPSQHYLDSTTVIPAKGRERRSAPTCVPSGGFTSSTCTCMLPPMKPWSTPNGSRPS
jgi:hypothetical protein